MKLLNAGVGIWQLIAKYPAMSAAIGNILVVLGASFGLHLSVDQLATTAAIVAGIFGILVHAGVIPVTKVDNVSAGIKPVVKGQASVLTTPLDPATVVPAVHYAGEPGPETVAPPSKFDPFNKGA